MDLRRIAAVLVVSSLSVLGCYSPNIGEGTYACGPDGGCPDKFHCASNHLCYQKADAAIDMQAVCKAAATLPQTCSLAGPGALAIPAVKVVATTVVGAVWSVRRAALSVARRVA